MTPGENTLGSVRQAIFRAPFFLYRKVLSPFLHAVSGSSGACRFQPTCSEYAALAVEHYGIVRGGGLAMARICKCHPWHRGGFDPVPGTWTPVESLQDETMQSSAPPVTIIETEFRAIPAADLRPTAATTVLRPSIGRPFARD